MKKDKEGTVTPSCGCVFCDIGVPIDSENCHVLDFGKGKLARHPSRIKCTNPDQQIRNEP
jgi:hypothetical protein